MKRKEKYSVYLVDDDSFYRDTIENRLRKDLETKINLKTFPTGEECLEQLYTAPPDIVILDYQLNSFNKDAMNGVKILNKIKSFSRDINVIMLSGQEKMEVAVNTVKWGAYDYVIKNENAFVRLKYLLGMITYRIHLNRNRKSYELWNILGATLFLIFALIMTIYIRNRYYN